jgi:Carboxypeptidase regulatory-like domain
MSPPTHESAMFIRLLPRSVAVWSAAGCLLVGPGADASLAHSVPDALTVTVINSGGNAVHGATVQLVGPTPSTVTSTSSTFGFSPITPGAYHVIVSKTGYCTREQPVTVSGGTSLTFVLNPTCADAISTGDSDSLIAVVRGKWDASGVPTCLDPDTALQGKGTLFLPHNMLPLADSPLSIPLPCIPLVAVLTKDHAAWFTDLLTTMGWTNAIGDALVPILRSPLAVPMRIFVMSLDQGTTFASKKTQIHDIHLEHADGLLANSYAGLVLGGESSAVEPVIEDLTTNGALVSAAGTGCDSVDSIKSHTELYDQGRLNVFYVTTIGDAGDGGSKAGLNCFAQGAPNIIFISSGEQGPFVLMHEVGHALGLTTPNSGHTQNMSGFLLDANNFDLDVMGGSSNVSAMYLSVGQVLHMHLKGDSWLNLSSGPGGSTLRQRAMAPAFPVIGACYCPESQRTESCPPLRLDIARVGTLSIWTGSPLVCFIEVDSPQAAIGCTSDTPVTAQYYQGHFPDWMVPAVANLATWTSLTPTKVTVKAGDFSNNKGSNAKLRGVSTGTGWVKVWTDGASADFPVTVYCP